MEIKIITGLLVLFFWSLTAAFSALIYSTWGEIPMFNFFMLLVLAIETLCCGAYVLYMEIRGT